MLKLSWIDRFYWLKSKWPWHLDVELYSPLYNYIRKRLCFLCVFALRVYIYVMQYIYIYMIQTVLNHWVAWRLFFIGVYYVLYVVYLCQNNWSAFHSVNCVGFALQSRCKLKKELCESDNYNLGNDLKANYDYFYFFYLWSFNFD